MPPAWQDFLDGCKDIAFQPTKLRMRAVQPFAGAT